MLELGSPYLSAIYKDPAVIVSDLDQKIAMADIQLKWHKIWHCKPKLHSLAPQKNDIISQTIPIMQ
jgi:hypothetical protein